MFEPKSGDEYYEVSVTVFEGKGHGDKVFSEAYETEAEALVRYDEIIADKLAETAPANRTVTVDAPWGLGEYNTEVVVGDVSFDFAVCCWQVV